MKFHEITYDYRWEELKFSKFTYDYSREGLKSIQFAYEKRYVFNNDSAQAKVFTRVIF